MVTRVLSITAVVLSLAASAAVAGNLTDHLQATRMTVLRVDQDTGKFMCAEHRRWTALCDGRVGCSGDLLESRLPF